MKLTVWRVAGIVVAIALVILFFSKKANFDVVLIGLFLCSQKIFEKDKS